MKPRIRTLTDPVERADILPELARLRISVFREWPYLYDGTEEYEASYLREFIVEPGSVLVIAEVADGIVGAATASPMTGQKPEFRIPFTNQTTDIEALFYFGESVLDMRYRGLGIGHSFFDAREEAARQAGATACCFCAVIRPEDHPLRPVKARNLHPFWRARGYAPAKGVTGSLSWKDIDQPQETPHDMQFWLRPLES